MIGSKKPNVDEQTGDEKTQQIVRNERNENSAPHAAKESNRRRDDQPDDRSDGESGGQRRSRRSRNKKRKDRKPHHLHRSERELPEPTHQYQKKRAPRKPELKEVPEKEGETRFADLNLDERILCALQDLEFKYCTPVQAGSLPAALEGRDVTGKAQTGTGKTAAFLIAMYNHMLNHHLHNRKPGFCRCLVLAPTRELAIQIHQDAEDIGKYCGFNNLVVYGGMGHTAQREALKKPIDILVGTPGRILDYMRSRDLHFAEVEILVIDEADRMLDMGFIPDVRHIVRRTPRPEERQTLFFSATLTREVTRLADQWLRNPSEVEIEPERLVTDLIEQRFYSVLSEEKYPFLLWVLNNEDVERVLVFVNRKIFTEKLAAKLNRKGVKCAALSSDVPQRKRLSILDRFKQGDIKIIIATDVAARGIHVEGISHVVNYDIPYKPEDYVHRIGRTGRVGSKGHAISLVCEYGAYEMSALEEYLGYEIGVEIPAEEMVTMPSGNKRRQ